MPAGRPTKHTPELIERAREYANGQYEIIGDVIPSIAGLANYLDITRETIHTWVNEEDKAEFSDIVKKMLQTQESVLIAKGLDSKFNASITKLILTKHGYSDKVEQTHAGKDGSPISIDITSAILAKIPSNELEALLDEAKNND
jgi:hypothetical protein